ncbi:MAG: hypothetical protein ABIL09_19960 [Gemmatimonadota bacterium]
MKRFAVSALALTGLMLLVGCDKPPVAEVDAARQAVANTRSAEAETYAAKEFRALNDSMNAVVAEVQRQSDRFIPSFDETRASLAKIEPEATRVATLARTNKKAIADATTAMVNTASAAIDSAATLLAAAPRGKGTQEDITAFENDLTQLRTRLSSSREYLTREQFQDAQKTAQTVRDGALNVQNELRMAIEKYQQLRGGRGGRRS